jgi:hypothetical protein
MRRTLHRFSWTLTALVMLGGCDEPGDEAEAGFAEEDEAGEDDEVSERVLLTMKGVMTLAKNAGLPCDRLVLAGALAKAESGLYTNAYHDNGPQPPQCPNGSRDRGLWQINNCWWANYSDACAYDATCNAKAMAAISNKGASFVLWSAYTNGSYKQYLAEAQAAYNSGISGCGAAPPPPPPPPPASEATCDELGYIGACVGKVSVWAEDNQCKVRDCAAEGKQCGWISNDIGWGCLGGNQGANTLDCEDLGYTGKCMSGTLVWAEDGACNTVYCPASGRQCVWDGPNGYNCK